MKTVRNLGKRECSQFKKSYGIEFTPFQYKNEKLFLLKTSIVGTSVK